MAGSRFDPAKEFSNLRDQLGRLMEDNFGTTSIPVDMYETADAVVLVTAPLYGLNTSTLDIEIAEGQLTFSGETIAPIEIANNQYIRRERRFGKFSRTIALPRQVRAEEAKAQYKESILTITVPKVAQAAPRVIKVTPVE